MKRLLAKLNSIKTKILILLIVVTLIPFITVTTILLTTSTSALKGEAKTIQENSAELNADRIDRWISKKITNMTNLLEENPDFLNGERSEITPSLETLAESDDEVDHFSFVTQEGTVKGTDGRELDVSDQTHFQKAKESEDVFVSDIREDEETGEHIIIVDVPLIHEDDGFNGVIQAIVESDEILNIVNNIEIGESGYGYLLSEDGTNLIHPDESKMGQSITETENAEVSATFEDTVLTDDSGYLSLENDDTEEIAAFDTIDETGWKLVTVAPENEVFAGVSDMSQTAIIIIVVAVIVI